MRPINLLLIAWKNLLAHRMRAVITIGGVAIGVAAIVFLVSLGFGLERLVTSQVANFEAFTIIDVPSANLKTGKINVEAIERIKKIGHVSSVNEVVDLAGRVRLDSQTATTETVVVSAPEPYYKLADTVLSRGKWFAADSTNEVAVNRSLAGLLGFSEKPEDIIGKKIVLDAIIPSDLRAADMTEGAIVKPGIELKVIGLNPDDTNPILYAPLALAESAGAINRTSLKLQIDDRKSIPAVRKAIENIGFSTEYVGDTVDQITQVFALFRIVLGGFGFVALLVAALGTFNILTISLIERIREVGLLKTLGMKRRDIFRLFIAESLTIGALGGISGILAGNIVGWGMNEALRVLALRAGADTVTIYYSPISFVLIVGLGSLLVGFLTGFYPAYRAIKTSPLDVIRYE